MLARGAQTNAKEDTEFLALSGALATDLSDKNTNLTTIGAGAYELNSARTALSSAWEIYARCELTEDDKDRVLVANHNAALTAITFALRITSGSAFAARMNGADIWTGPAVPTAGDCSFAWHMRSNPDTTGSSDAKISEFIVYDHTAGEYLAIEQVTHEAPTADAGHTLSVGGAYLASGPSLINAPDTAPSKVRISSSSHNSVEFAEDWVAARTAYAGSLDDGPEEPLGPVSIASTIGDSGYFVGRHQVGYAAAVARAVQRRGWSSLVNDTFVDPDTLTSSASPANWVQPDFGAGTYVLMIPWLRWVSVPSGCTHAWVRVQVKSWVTAGAAVPIGVRVYAMNRPSTIAQIGQTPAPAFVGHYREATLTTDHTSTGTGEWLELGLVRLPVFDANVVGWKDTVHLCLAYAIDPAAASANDANARLQILAWHARPVFKWTPGSLE